MICEERPLSVYPGPNERGVDIEGQQPVRPARKHEILQEQAVRDQSAQEKKKAPRPPRPVPPKGIGVKLFFSSADCFDPIRT